jgi:hypothetical protein
MIFVHKKSATPVMHWSVLRHGGANNLGDASARGKFLLLWNVEVVVREGAWNYIFEFDTRDSLEVSALAQLAGRGTSYPDDVDWRKWLGADAQVINEEVREAILSMPPDEARTEALITDVREAPIPTQIPGRGPHNAYQNDSPKDFLITS